MLRCPVSQERVEAVVRVFLGGWAWFWCDACQGTHLQQASPWAKPAVRIEPPM